MNCDHFNVGNELMLYGRNVILGNCDTFTRNFLTQMGVKVPVGTPVPVDSNTAKRQGELS